VWIALAAAITVLIAVAIGRIVEQSSGSDSTPSVSTGGTLTVTRAWTRDLGQQVDRAIDVSGGRTIVDVAPETTGDSTLVALDRSSGKVLWRHRFASRNGPWGVDGHVLVTGIQGRTAGIDLRTGRQLWLVDVNAVSGEQAPPILVHEHVAYPIGGGDEGTMTALDVRTHRVLWQQPLGGTVLVTPVATRNAIVAAVSIAPIGDFPGKILTLDPAFGAAGMLGIGVEAEAFVGLADWPAAGQTVATASHLSLAPLLGGAVCCYLVRSAATESASLALEGSASRPLVLGRTVVVATGSGKTTAYRADTPVGDGVPVWVADVGATPRPDVTAAAGNAVIAGGSVAALSPTDGTTAWTASVRDAYFPAPGARDVVVAISRTDGRMYVLDANDGRVVRTMRNGTALNAVTLRADSLVTASGGGIVTGYRITRR
jgi:outer membrane protein assembly factor BamB